MYRGWECEKDFVIKIEKEWFNEVGNELRENDDLEVKRRKCLTVMEVFEEWNFFRVRVIFDYFYSYSFL